MSAEATRRRRPPALAIGVAVAAGVLLLVVAAAVFLGGTDDGQSSARDFSEPTGTADVPVVLGHAEPWNGRAFINDNLWTEGDLEFGVWVDPGGSPVVGRRRGEGEWSTTDLGRLPGNPLGAPTARDEHNVYAIGVDAAGFVHVAGNMHHGPLRYVRSEKPREIDAWVQGDMVGTEEEAVSYPAFVRAPGGNLLFFYRDGGAGQGDVLLNRLDAGAGSWQRVATLIDGRSSEESPYLQRVAVDPIRGFIHLMFLWRSGTDPADNRDPSYLWSYDGGTTWRMSNSTPVRLPVTHRTADVVAPTSETSVVLLNQGGLAVDRDGRPHAVFRIRDGGDVLHLWQEGRGWRAEEVSGLGDVVGRPALVGGGREPLLLLWAQGRGLQRSELRLGRLDGDRLADQGVLASLPLTDWEPTFDSTAMAERRLLRLLLPVRRVPGPEPAAQAAVATWSIATLEEDLSR